MKSRKVKTTADLRTDAESRADEGGAEQIEFTEADNLKLIHELRVHQIELELQNEELTDTRERLEAAIEKYDNFYNFAPVGYFTLSRKGVITEANLTASAMIGVDRSRLLGSRFTTYIRDDLSSIAFRKLISGIFANKRTGACQLNLTGRDGQELCIYLEVSLPMTEDKCLAIATDISELKRYQDELFSSEEKFRIISESSPDHVTMQDGNLRYTWSSNPMLGYRPEELLGKTDSEVFGDDTGLMLERVKRSVFSGGEPQNINFSVTDSKGTSKHLESTFVPFLSSQGIVVGIIGYSRDVTERVAIEKRLHDTNSYLEQLISYANTPIIVWNPFLQVQVFNRAFEKLTGYDSSEIIGQKINILFPELSRKRSVEMIRRTLEGSYLENIEMPILTKHGETKIVLWNSANICELDGISLISTIAQGNDITSRKKTEEALMESQRKLEIALESGNIGTWQWDSSCGKFRFDKRTEKLLGLKDGTFDGSAGSLEALVVEDDFVLLREAIQNAADHNVPLETVFRVKLEDGGIKHLITKGQCYRDNIGHIKITGVLFDITELKKQTEHTLFRVNEDLIRSNRDLEQFAYVASHDLQEPLRMVSSFTQLLARQYTDKLDKTANEYIQFAVDGSKRMYDLINGLLAYSRINTRGRSFRLVDLNEVIEQVKKNLDLKIGEKSARIKAEKLPVVLGDENQMIQLFQNLMLNSMKFCDKEPSIEISSESVRDEHIIRFTDNGIGIEPEYCERIFQIFQRLHTSDEYEGTGIGLAICKRIAERHGGTIRAESEPGKGSSFIITIPTSGPAT